MRRRSEQKPKRSAKSPEMSSWNQKSAPKHHWRGNAHQHNQQRRSTHQDHNMDCQKCKQKFNLTNRMPVMFDCGHSECIDCITVSRVCSYCNAGTLPSGITTSRKEQLPINFYIVGRLFCNNASPMNNRNDNSFVSFLPPKELITTESICTDKCSSVTCTKKACLRCLDCLELYCKLCSDSLHSSAKGLRKHKIYSLNISECTEHAGNVEEFFCNDCNKAICSYCAVAEHNGHALKQVTKLDAQNLPKFKSLLEGCETALVKIDAVSKRIQNYQSHTHSVLNSGEVQNEITKCFLELHAKLQLHEFKLIHKIQTIKNESLHEIRQKLERQKQELQNVLNYSKNIVENQQTTKESIDKVMENMQSVINASNNLSTIDSPCNVRFICGDLFRNLESNFNLTVETTKGKSTKTLRFDGLSKLSSGDDDLSDISISSTSTRSSKSSPHSSQKSFNASTSKAVEYRKKPIIKETTLEFYKSDIFKKEDKENVKVIHIESPEKIYVQLIKHNKYLKLMHKKLLQHMNSCQRPPSTQLERDAMYIVKLSDNIRPDCCRCNFLTINPDTTLKVFLLDFGVTVDVKRNHLFDIPPELSNVPKFCYDCKIYGLYPHNSQKWDADITKLIAAIIMDCEVMMRVLNEVNGILEVDFIAYDDDVPCSLRESLFYLGWGKLFDDEVQVSPFHIKRNERLKILQSNPMYSAGQQFDVVISHVNDPLNLYVQNYEFMNSIISLHERMFNHYVNLKKGYIYTPEKGMVVAVSVAENTWHRGQIMDIIAGKAQVSVYLVDIGKTVIVPWNYIRTIDEKFICLEAQAIPVRLVHVDKVSTYWAPAAIDYLKKFVTSKERLEMIIKDGKSPFDVMLFKHMGNLNICINASLVNEGLAKSCGELSLEIEWPREPEDDVEVETFTLNLLKTTQGYNCNSDDVDSDDNESEDGSSYYLRTSVNVIHIKSPSCIYIHFSNDADFNTKLELLHKELQQHYRSTSLKNKPEWKVNDYGVAYDSNRKKFYRILVEQVCNNGDSYEVFSRDFGHCFTVRKDEMGSINDAYFLSVPPFALRCHLYGVRPAGNDWSLTSIDFLTDIMLKKRNIYFTKVTNIESSDLDLQSTPAVFWYREFKSGSALMRSTFQMHNINKSLAKNGLAIKSKDFHIPKQIREVVSETKLKHKNIILDGKEGNWLPALPLEADNFFALATYVDEDATIYLHELRYNEQLEEMEQTMTDYFQYSPTIPTEWNVGNRCSVQYHQNQKWYRGTIVAETDNKYKACMVDYGNVEDVEDFELRPTIMYSEVPIIAQKIRLLEVYPKDTKFNITELEVLHQKIVAKKIHIFVKQIDTGLPLTIVHLDSQNINTFMTSNFKNCTKEPFNIESPDSKLPIQWKLKNEDVIVNGDSTNEGRNLYYIYAELPPQRTFNAIINNHLDYNKIVFMINDRPHKSVFDKLTIDLQNLAENQPPFSSKALKVPCLAKYTDDSWYRGLVLSKDADENIFTIYFVDYGNWEDVHINNLREIKQEWLEHPIEQYDALLHNFEKITDIKKREEMCKVLESYYNTTKKIKVISRDPLTVEIYDIDSDNLAYDNVIVKNILKWEDSED